MFIQTLKLPCSPQTLELFCMHPIPIKVRNALAIDPAMKHCLFCSNPPEWDHVITGLGQKQLQEWWAIAPRCTLHHRGSGNNQETKERAELWCLRRGKDELHKYPKRNLLQRYAYLTKKYGKTRYSPGLHRSKLPGDPPQLDERPRSLGFTLEVE